MISPLNSFATLLALSLLAVKAKAIDEGQRTFYPEESSDAIGVYVYKSVAPFENHIKSFIEPNNGAHYYAQTKYSSDYWNVIGTIDLRTLSLNLRTANDKNRVAVMSLNVLTELGVVDIGIENEGNGWFAFFYSGHLNKSAQSPPYNQDYTKKEYPTAKKVEFSIDAKIEDGQDRVIGHFRFLDRYSRELGTELLTFYVPRGEFYRVDGYGNPKLRFTRFMSLLPHGADNTAAKDETDFSYMRKAKFTGLQLYHRTQGYQVWNMDRVDYAWSVQTANIQNLRISSPLYGASDFCSIYHQYDYHH